MCGWISVRCLQIREAWRFKLRPVFLRKAVTARWPRRDALTTVIEGRAGVGSVNCYEFMRECAAHRRLQTPPPALSVKIEYDLVYHVHVPFSSNGVRYLVRFLLPFICALYLFDKGCTFRRMLFVDLYIKSPRFYDIYCAEQLRVRFSTYAAVSFVYSQEFQYKGIQRCCSCLSLTTFHFRL